MRCGASGGLEGLNVCVCVSVLILVVCVTNRAVVSSLRSVNVNENRDVTWELHPSVYFPIPSVSNSVIILDTGFDLDSCLSEVSHLCDMI